MELNVIHANCAGIDVGSDKHYVCAEQDLFAVFGTYHVDCLDIVAYLHERKVSKVAMESTGVYWYHLYEVLENAGFEVYLVNPRQTKHPVEGRKSDPEDCQWIRTMLSYGLLTKSFIPSDAIREMRAYHRLREDHVRSKAQQENLMGKALISMNVRLTEVLSSLTTVSGLEMIRAIVAGERDVAKLLSLCHSSVIKNKSGNILKALEGSYKAEHVFGLQQALNGWDFFDKQVKECDVHLEKCLVKLGETSTIEKVTTPSKSSRTTNMPAIKDLHEKIVKATDGRNPAEIFGISDYTAVKLIAELGTDFSPWANPKRFTNWLGLAPVTKQSGKMRKKIPSHRTRAGQIFRDAAQGLINVKDNVLSEFMRKIRGRSGPAAAIKAGARKLATYYYYLMKEGVVFVEQGLERAKEKIIEKKKAKLQRLATELGYDFTLIMQAMNSQMQNSSV
jgi:transposase